MEKNFKSAVRRMIPKITADIVRDFLDVRNIHRMASAPRIPFNPDLYPAGINLVGSFYQDSGLGQSCRLLADEIRKAGVPHSFINFAFNSNLHYSGQNSNDISRNYKYGINVFHINMHEFPRAWTKINDKNKESHYNIAFWLWENEVFPKEWVPMIKQLDEIWTPSEFVSRSIRVVTDKPVKTIPYIIETPYDNTIGRKYFHLPKDQFLFLMMYDVNSLAERKNPLGAVHAFRKAFQHGSHQAGMVIKISNANEETVKRLKEELNGYDVYFINEMLEKDKVNALIHCCDAYISLHRAEGYGLVLSEAMMLGVPTIATAYSANLDFQDETRACLVKYNMKSIDSDLFPYRKGMKWADPDEDDAAQYMRRLCTDSEFYAKIRDNAWNYMHDPVHAKETLDRLKRNFEVIYESNKGTI